MKQKPLFINQQKTIDKAIDLPYFADFSDAGTGKTRSALELFSRKRVAHPGKLLVITTKSTMQAAWGATIKEFFPNLTYSIAVPPRRLPTITQATTDVVITNHDGVKDLITPGFTLPAEYTYLIVDESTAFKNPNSKRTKALLKIAPLFTTFRMVMTGTPTSNSLLDIFTQIKVLDGGKHLGANYYAFRNVITTIENNYTPFKKYIVKSGAEKAIGNTLRPISIRNIFEECISIPNHNLSM
ncbi:MAG: hypothetical protein DRQ47_09110, partial [Gammaproteobacteria bacterium]